MKKFFQDKYSSNYVSKMFRSKILDIAEERELIFKYQTKKDKTSMLKIVLAFQKLVISISIKHLNFGNSLMDLIQEGNIGLINALEKFDLSKNIYFGTYARFFIKSKIQNYVFKYSSIISIPNSNLAKKIFFTLNNFFLKNEEFSKHEVKLKEAIDYYSTLFNQPKKTIENLLIFLNSSTLSIENDSDEKQNLIEKLKSNSESQESEIIQKEEIKILKKKFDQAIKILSKKELEIIKKRWILISKEKIKKNKLNKKEKLIEKMILRKIRIATLLNKK